jgi:hypothetical protein
MTMLLTIIATGIIIGYLVGKALKYYSTGFGYSNDIDNQPIIIKSCLYCNTKISRDYKKNLCPHCYKPLE